MLYCAIVTNIKPGFALKLQSHLELDTTWRVNGSANEAEVRIAGIAGVWIQIPRLPEDVPVCNVERVGANFKVDILLQTEAFSEVRIFVKKRLHAESGNA